MSEAKPFEPKIVAYVCNWCTYLGADLAGTTRLEYPANVRIVRLPCTGRIDFNLLVKALEIGADAVLVSGCHPGDCHYTAGNYHARRRWMLFRELLDTLGFDLRRIHFTWISAAEGRKWQEEITRITEETRKLGPYRELYQKNGFRRPPAPLPPPKPPAPAKSDRAAQEQQLRETCRKLLEDGTVQVVIGYGAGGPVFIRRAEDAGKLVWNMDCQANLTTYLKRKEIKRLGKAAVVVKGCDERGLVILEKESQIDRQTLRVVGMACEGMGQPKCDTCEVHQPRFADEIIGETADVAPGFSPAPAALKGGATGTQPLDTLMQMSPAERMSFWAQEFERCVKCYACRQVCPLCYCERCIADKNRPVAIDTSATPKGNFAWHITRAFHLAGRCVGCGECTRACPAGIPLELLNLTLARAAEKHFAYRAGMDPQAEPLIGSYALTDKEDFIR
ncbi:MAG: hydrogenase iron-sulfur subunit [Terriglobia bacterium]|jgi:coenzyme F420-reducing hydrogenase delta subunit/ferredoxin